MAAVHRAQVPDSGGSRTCAQGLRPSHGDRPPRLCHPSSACPSWSSRRGSGRSPARGHQLESRRNPHSRQGIASRPDAPSCGCGRGPGLLPASRSSSLPNASGIRLHEGATPWLCWSLDTDDNRSPRTRPRELTPEFKGAHLLRHSLATSMLRSGATMGEIGEVLRHRAPNTTEIYAKVDFDGLRSLAHPWPMGGAQ